MSYESWESRHRLTTIRPGKLDLFAVTLVNGRRASVDPITAYDAVLTRAEGFQRDYPCQAKVLPLTGAELRNLFGLVVPIKPQPLDEATRHLHISTLTDVITHSSDEDARRDAVSLLKEMGVLLS